MRLKMLGTAAVCLILLSGCDDAGSAAEKQIGAMVEKAIGGRLSAIEVRLAALENRPANVDLADCKLDHLKGEPPTKVQAITFACDQQYLAAIRSKAVQLPDLSQITGRAFYDSGSEYIPRNSPRIKIQIYNPYPGTEMVNAEIQLQNKASKETRRYALTLSHAIAGQSAGDAWGDILENDDPSSFWQKWSWGFTSAALVYNSRH